MQGTVYKELRQNRLLLIVGTFLPLAVILIAMTMGLIILLSDYGEYSSKMYFSGFRAGGDIFFSRLLMLSIVYYAMGMASSLVFSGDESKKWGCFMAAVPHGAERSIYGKYVFIFMMYAMFFVSALFTDGFVCWLTYCFTGEIPESLTSLFMMMLFLQIFIRAFEIPFYARFGTKKGSYVRLAAVGFFILIAVIWALFFPQAYEITDDIARIAMDFLNGDHSEEITFIMCLFPLVSIGAYLVSYRISCAVWLKGVQNYEK